MNLHFTPVTSGWHSGTGLKVWKVWGVTYSLGTPGKTIPQIRGDKIPWNFHVQKVPGSIFQQLRQSHTRERPWRGDLSSGGFLVEIWAGKLPLRGLQRPSQQNILTTARRMGTLDPFIPMKRIPSVPGVRHYFRFFLMTEKLSDKVFTRD